MERIFPFSIYSKIAVAMSGLIVAVVVATSWITLERTMRQYRQHMTEAGILIARLIANYSLEPVVMGNYSSLRSVLAEVLDSNQHVMVIEVLDENGTPCVGVSRETIAGQHPADATGAPGFSPGDGIAAAAGSANAQGPAQRPQGLGADGGADAAWPEVTSPIVAYGRTWGDVNRLKELGLEAPTSALNVLGRLVSVPKLPFGVGRKVDVVVRPEQLRLETAPSEGLLQGTVTSCTYLGSLLEYEVKVTQDIKILATVHNPRRSRALSLGATVGLSFDLEDLHVLPV
ncbi:MAG: TOBE domain-containing protein [Betaproteobacteria bacterium]